MRRVRVDLASGRGAHPRVHGHFYAQALAKIERGQAQDESDVQEMLRRGVIDRNGIMRHFEQIESLPCRFPAIDAATFRRAVERVCRPEHPARKP